MLSWILLSSDFQSQRNFQNVNTASRRGHFAGRGARIGYGYSNNLGFACYQGGRAVTAGYSDLSSRGVGFNKFRGGNQNFRCGWFNSNRGRGGNSSSKPQCQLCQRFGHTVWQCFYRFDETFQFNTPSCSTGSAELTAMLIEPPQDSFEMNDIMGNLNMDVDGKVWYSDSRESHHCTPN